MNDAANVAALRAGYRLWSERDPEAVAYWMNLLADDVSWRSLADGAAGMEFSRACHCKADVARYFEELARDWDMNHFTVDEFLAQGDRVVVLARCGWTHKRTGTAVESPKVDVFRMRDGKIVEFAEYYDTAKALAATK